MNSFLDVAMDETEFTLLEKKRVPDGEGGYTTTYTEGIKFKGAVRFNSSITAKIAEAQGVKSLYTLTLPKGLPLEFHDILKTENKLYRLTTDGDDVQTPNVATFQFMQVSAEEWVMPV